MRISRLRLAFSQGIGDNAQQGLVAHFGLGQIVACPGLDDPRGDQLVTLAGDHHHGRLHPLVVDGFQKFQAVAVG